MYFGKSAKECRSKRPRCSRASSSRPAGRARLSTWAQQSGRRNYVLQRMADEGFITQAEADTAKKQPIVVKGQPQQARSSRPVLHRRGAQAPRAEYGAKALYEGGLSVTSTLDATLQEAANRAVDRGVRAWTSGEAIAGRRGTCWRRANRSRRSRTSVGPGRSRSATSCPPSWRPRKPRARQRRAPAHRLAITADLAAGGLCMDPAAGGRQPLQDGRPHRSSGAGAGQRTPSLRSPWNSARSSRARSWPSTTGPARSRPWWAAATSAAASSTGPSRHSGSSGRRSSRSSIRPRSIAGTRRPRSSSTSLSSILRKRRALQPAELRPQVRRPGHVAALARAIAQHPGDQGAWTRSGRRMSSPTASASASARNSRRTCRSRSAPATARSSK